MQVTLEEHFPTTASSFSQFLWSLQAVRAALVKVLGAIYRQASFRLRSWSVLRSGRHHNGNVKHGNVEAAYGTRHTAGFQDMFSRSSEFRLIKDLQDTGSMEPVGCEMATLICFSHYLSSRFP